MPINGRNVENAILEGTNRFETWKQKFDDQWSEPQIKTAITGVWRSVPPQMRKLMDPTIVKQMDDLYGEGAKNGPV